MPDTIEDELKSIMEMAAAQLNLKNYSLDLNLDGSKLDGYLGEMYKVAIVREDNSRINLVVKRAPRTAAKRHSGAVLEAYKNEIQFYSEVLPALDKFQQSRRVPNPIKLVPNYFASVREVGKEAILLEDLTVEGFQLREKDFYLDDEHARLIFASYGRFHALSYAFRLQHPQEFQKLMDATDDYYTILLSKDGFRNEIGQLANKAIRRLDPVRDAELLQWCQREKLADNAVDVFGNSYQYNGEFTVILHGDCWLNNIMFKYEDFQNHKNLKEIQLLDFQLVRTGSPICDLSYCFYTGATKELYPNLKIYLDIYRENFCKFARDLGCSVSEVLPKEIPHNHWSKFAKLGLFMSLIHIKVRLMKPEDLAQLSEDFNTMEGSQKFVDFPCDEEAYNGKIKDILKHLSEWDI